MELTLDRSEVCRLLIACEIIAQYHDEDNDVESERMWRKLKGKIKEQLIEFDLNEEFGKKSVNTKRHGRRLNRPERTNDNDT